MEPNSMIEITNKDGKLINLDDKVNFYENNLESLKQQTLFSEVELRALFNQNKLEDKSEIQKRNYISQAARRLKLKIRKLYASMHLFGLIPLIQSLEDLDKYPEQIFGACIAYYETIMEMQKDLWKKIDPFIKKLIKHIESKQEKK